ncbi:hypothetical protein C1645_741486 [Glomus cerebriforme]|uniref:HMG box domain-containing protein n=1 Tax=Glomus cerebriforme TaxID=658196 RepID=A0A397SRV2_9GLOM|nr:hypothetical protein C1645_741486 [Glomus cerebriforme]
MGKSKKKQPNSKKNSKPQYEKRTKNPWLLFVKDFGKEDNEKRRTKLLKNAKPKWDSMEPSDKRKYFQEAEYLKYRKQIEDTQQYDLNVKFPPKVSRGDDPFIIENNDTMSAKFLIDELNQIVTKNYDEFINDINED